MNLRNAAIAWLVVLATACAGTLDNRDGWSITDATDAGAASPPPPAAACPDVPQAVLAPKCATAGCHAAAAPQSGLDLASPNLAARLVGIGALTGGFLIDPVHPEQSTLYRRLLPNAPGPRMPSGAPLDDATIACVLSWARGVAGSGSSPPPPPMGDASPGPTGDAGAADAPARTATRVAPGSTAPYTDHDLNVWSVDTGFTGGQTSATTTPITIDKTNDSPLYNAERYGTFSYAFPVANGSYTVTLGFAETFTAITASGQRLFNVSANGQQVLTAFDIFAEAGGRNIAVTKSFPVDVTGGMVTLNFDPGAVQNPKVDTIAIVPK